MNSADTTRILIGIGTLGTAVGVGVLALRYEPPRDRDFSPSIDVVRAAVDAGVDIADGTPKQKRDAMRQKFDAGAAISFDKVEFKNGLYVWSADGPENGAAPGELFSGYLAMVYEGGEPELICTVVNGRLEGPSIEFWEDGSIKRSLNHKDGRPVGQIIEFFEDGNMKLRAMAYGTDESGGTTVGEITVGSYKQSGYARRDLGTGRIQFIYDDGTCEGMNEKTPLDEVEGWMLFYDRMLGGQGVYTTDSRGVSGP